MPYIPLGTLTGNVAPTTNRFDELQVSRLVVSDTITLTNAAVVGYITLDSSLGYKSSNPGGGSVLVEWEDNYWRFRMSGSATPRGIRLDNYDNTGISLDRLGKIVVEGEATIDVWGVDNYVRGYEPDGTTENWRIGNVTGSNNFIIDVSRSTNDFYLRTDPGTGLINRLFFGGAGQGRIYDNTGNTTVLFGTNGAADRLLIYDDDGTTTRFGVSDTAKSLWARHPDSSSWTEMWPFGSNRQAGTIEGATTTMTTTETSLWSSTFTVTANEPVVVQVWWRIRIESTATQYYWGRVYIGGSEFEVNGGVPSIIDPGGGSQSASHTHTGPSHSHAVALTSWDTDSVPGHSHTLPAGTGGNTTGNAGTGATGTQSASHSHAPGFYHHFSGIGYRAYTPTGTTVAIALYGRSETSSVNARAAVMVLIWRT